MNTNHDTYLELCAAYSLGALDGEDAQRLREHLEKGCDQCEAAIGDFSEATVGLAAGGPAVRPRMQLRKQVLSAVHAEKNRPQGEGGPSVVALPTRPRSSRFLLAASILFALTSVALWQHTRNLRSELDQVRIALTAAEDRLNRTETRLVRAEMFLDLYTSPQTHCFDLASTGDANTTQGSGSGCFNADQQQAFVVFEDLQVPEGRDLELWVLRGAQPTSLGVISVDASGHALMQLQSIASPQDVTAFAVSLEPVGGSPQPTPTGAVVFVGAIGG